jgi:hypothetical protein
MTDAAWCVPCVRLHDPRLHQGAPQASRVITASRVSRCVLGGCDIHPGDEIGLLAGGWALTSCILTAAARTWPPDEPEEPF